MLSSFELKGYFVVKRNGVTALTLSGIQTLLTPTL